VAFAVLKGSMLWLTVFKSECNKNIFNTLNTEKCESFFTAVFQRNFTSWLRVAPKVEQQKLEMMVILMLCDWLQTGTRYDLITEVC